MPPLDEPEMSQQEFDERAEMMLSMAYLRTLGVGGRVADDADHTLVRVLGQQEGGGAEGGGAARRERQAKADVAKVGRARAAVIRSLARLEEHDKRIKGLMRARYRCAGYALVTLDHLLTVAARPRPTP